MSFEEFRKMREKIQAAKDSIFALEEEISNNNLLKFTEAERAEWRKQFYSLRVQLGYTGSSLLNNIGDADD